MKSGPDDALPPADREPFLERWSRRKVEEQRETPPVAREQGADPAAAAPELPPIDKLTLESDYRDFFHPKVGEETRRSALKKLFSDPRFNVMDGLDTYIDDYSKSEPIPPEMLAGLKQAQNILRWAKEDEEQRERDKLAQAAPAQTLAPAGAQAGPETGIQPDTPEAAPVAAVDAGGQAKS